MENKDTVNKICFLLEKKLRLFKEYLSLAEQVKEVIGSDMDESRIPAVLHKRRDCINNIDMIDGSIKKIMQARNSENDHASERLRDAIDPYLKDIRKTMGLICRLDSELLVMAREETQHFQTKLLQMRKFRKGVSGYKRTEELVPRFLDKAE
jgi:hypothetical protein